MLGYACINTVLKEQKIMTNRGMIRKTFDERGLDYVSELALSNLYDLMRILQWNVKEDIRFFRVSSNIFPWWEFYELTDLPDFRKIEVSLYNIGKFVKSNGIRLTTHPDHFVKLASPDNELVEKSIITLTRHAQMFDFMKLDQTPYYKINVHVGGTYGDKEATLARFCENFGRLPVSVQSRLTIENDDTATGYSVVDLYAGIYKQIRIPIVFDVHHHQFNTGGLDSYDAMVLALSTWNVKPVIHYSESREDSKNPRAHSDYVDNMPDWEREYESDFDVMIEAKKKEQALFCAEIFKSFNRIKKAQQTLGIVEKLYEEGEQK